MDKRFALFKQEVEKVEKGINARSEILFRNILNKKTAALSLVFLIMLFLIADLLSQPKFTFHASAGFSTPMQDFKQYDFTDDITQDTVTSNWPYMMKNGYSFGIDGKYAFGKKRSIRLAGGAGISIFSNEGNLSTGTSLLLKMNIITLSLGGEYAFILTKNKVIPYVGADITANFFSGKIEPYIQGKSKFKNETRLGIQGSAGLDFEFSKNFGAIIGAKYNFANLFGKNSDETAPEEVGLGDKEHNGISSKNISYLQILAGISVYFGMPKEKNK